MNPSDVDQDAAAGGDAIASELRRRMSEAFDQDAANFDDNDLLGPATPDPASKPVNIKFCGRRVFDKAKRKVVTPNDPIERFSDRGELIELPPAAFQINRRLFYHSDARRIVRSFPHLYKLVKPK